VVNKDYYSWLIRTDILTYLVEDVSTGKQNLQQSYIAHVFPELQCDTDITKPANWLSSIPVSHMCHKKKKIINLD